MYKRFDLSDSSPWRCLRCGLVFYEEIAAGKKVMDMTTKYHAIYFKEFGVAVLQ